MMIHLVYNFSQIQLTFIILSFFLSSKYKYTQFTYLLLAKIRQEGRHMRKTHGPHGFSLFVFFYFLLLIPWDATARCSMCVCSIITLTFSMAWSVLKQIYKNWTVFLLQRPLTFTP